MAMGPFDLRRMRIRQAGEMGVVEQENLPNEEGTLPGETSWRYRLTDSLACSRWWASSWDSWR